LKATPNTSSLLFFRSLSLPPLSMHCSNYKNGTLFCWEIFCITLLVSFLFIVSGALYDSETLKGRVNEAMKTVPFPFLPSSFFQYFAIMFLISSFIPDCE
jgi:hypothetical protein